MNKKNPNISIYIYIYIKTVIKEYMFELGLLRPIGKY